jgi:hypothetical protein
VAALRHPARHFIYYLLSRRIYDATRVIEELEEFGLPIPKRMLHEKELRHLEIGSDFYVLAQDILKARAEMAFPSGFEPNKRLWSDSTRTFLERWKIAGMWRSDRAVTTAIEMLTEPPIRTALELLLLSPLAARDIAHRLCVRFDIEPSVMNAAVVRAFGHYFWDVNALDSAQWRSFVNAHRALARDEYLSMLSAPRSASGVAFAIAVVDRDPQLLSASDRYEAASAMAFSMLMRQAVSDKSGAPYAAFTALNMMRMADDELEKHRGGSSDLLAEFTRIRTLHDQARPTSIIDAPYVQRPLALLKSHEGEPSDDK